LHFRTALTEFVAVLEPRPHSLSEDFVEWVPKKGKAKQATVLRQRVNEAAGPAAEAAATTGVMVTINPAGYFGMPPRKVNAIGSWAGALTWPNQPAVDDILGYADLVASLLGERASVAEAEERTLAGRLARFLAFPYAVQDGVHSQHPRFPRKVAFGAGVAAQIAVGFLVAVVSGLIVLWLGIKLGLAPDP
jgi:hypothetical protein